MGYNLRYSDYVTPAGPPDPSEWVGPPGPPGPVGPIGPQGVPGDVGDVLADGSTTARNLTDRFAEVVSVMDYGAVGDGVTLDTAAIRAAAAAIPAGGGRLYFPGPARTYMVDGTTLIPGGTTVCGDGPSTVVRAVEGDWEVIAWTPTNPYGVTPGRNIFCNVGWDAATITDESISFENIGFHCAEPSAAQRKAPYTMRMVRHVSARNLHCYGGGNGPTHLACEDVEVAGCRIINFHSGGIEFWESCSGARVINNYLQKAASASDPNIEFTSSTSTNSPGHSKRFVCTGNVVLGGSTGVFSIGITDTDTVAKTSTVDDIIISDNLVDLAANYGGGGAVTGAQGIGCYGGGGNYLITNNLIRNIVDARALYVHDNGRNTPRAVTVSRNRVQDCTAVTATGALVNIKADYSAILDNDIIDCTCIVPYVISGNENMLRLGVLSPQGTSGSTPRYSIIGTGALITDPDLDLNRTTFNHDLVSTTGFRIGSSGSLLASYIENGTWTPSLQFGGVTTGITYSVQTGVYQRIGKLIYVSCMITLTSKGVATGNAQITGLPVSQVAATATRLPVSTAQNFSTITTEPCVRINANVIALVTTGLTSGVNLTNAEFANNSVLNFNGWFLAA
jgi:hypothetical protein